MMKEVTIFAALLAATGVWVWQISHQPEVITNNTVLAFDPGGTTLQSIHLVEPGLETALRVEKEGDEITTRITSSVRKKVAMTGPDPAPGEPEWGAPEVRSFPGNKDAAVLVGNFSPLKAVRRFDEVDDASRTEMGLDKAVSTLTLKAGAEEVAFLLGEKAYSSQDYYAARQGGSEVYLLPGSLIAPLQKVESRLQDRALSGEEEGEVITLQLGGEVSLSLVHQGRHDKTNAWWKVEGGPEERDPAVDAWVDKLFGLKAINWPTEAEVKAQGEILPSVTVRLVGERGPLDEIQLGISKEDPSRWFGRSQHTGVWVQVGADVAGELRATASNLARSGGE